MDHDAEGGRLFITGQGGVSDHCIAKSVAEVSNTRRLVDAFDEGGGSVHKSHLEFGAEKVVHNDGQGVVRLQVLERVGERETWLEFSKKKHSNENAMQQCPGNKKGPLGTLKRPKTAKTP